MNYDRIFEDRVFLPERALALGFTENVGQYRLVCPEEGNIDLVFTFDPTHRRAFVRAMDRAFGEEYPLSRSEHGSAFAAGLCERAAERMRGFLSACFADLRVRSRLLSHLQRRFGTVAAYPFADDDVTAVLRCPGGKWYGIIMTIPYRRLGVPSEEPVDVLNVKLQPERIRSLLDGRVFFPAYHMNKTYWMSVVLSATVPFLTICALAEESYALVMRKTSRAAQNAQGKGARGANRQDFRGQIAACEDKEESTSAEGEESAETEKRDPPRNEQIP